MSLQEETETLTIRLPKGLKALVEDTARLRSTSVTAIVRESLQNGLQPAGTLTQSAGMTAAFQAFLEHEAEGKSLISNVLIQVREPRGERYFLRGNIDRSLSKHGVVAVADHRMKWCVPRQDIVAWFRGEPAALDVLSHSLMRQGWAPR